MRHCQIVFVLVCLLCLLPPNAFTQEPEKNRLHEIEQELNALEGRLGEDLEPDERRHLERTRDDLLNEARGHEDHISLAGEEERPPPAGDDESLFENPTVIAAIIGAVGVILAALISLLRRDRS